MINFLRLVDRYVIGFVVYCFSPLRHIPNLKRVSSKPQKILLIRLWGMGSAILTLPLLKAVEDSMNGDVSITVLSTHITHSVFEFAELRKPVRQLSLFSWRDVLKLISSYKKYNIIIDTEEYFQISALIALWCGKKSIGFDTKFPRKYAYTDSIKYDDKKHVVQVFLDLLRPINTSKISAHNLVPLST